MKDLSRQVPKPELQSISQFFTASYAFHSLTIN